MQFRTIARGLILAGSLAAFPAAHADDQDVIDYRKHIMKTMGEQVASMGMMLQNKVPADNFATHAKILAVAAATAKKAFEPKVTGGDSKPELWTNWTDAAKRFDELTANTAELAKVAASGGAAAAGPKMQTLLTCKGCHDNYRVPKK